jgi:hypothetical protein
MGDAWVGQEVGAETFVKNQQPVSAIRRQEIDAFQSRVFENRYSVIYARAYVWLLIINEKTSNGQCCDC